MAPTTSLSPARTRASRRALVMRIGGRRYALPVEDVEIVLWSAALTPLPGAPRIVLGLFNFHGRLFPVLDAPCRLGDAAPGPVRATDLFVLTNVGPRPVALRVDGVDGVVTAISASDSGAGVDESRFVKGVLRLPDGLLLVHDVAAFLTDEEATDLDRACRSGDVA